MTLNLYLVRHGLIKANVSRVWHGSTDSPLLWRGRRQAKRLGKYLARTLPKLDAVYSSPLQRCQRTAQLGTGYAGCDTTTLDGLAEMSVGEWEGAAFKWLVEEHDFMQRLTTDLDYAAPQGESLKQVAQRTTAALAHIRATHETGTVVAVSHGIALAVMLAATMDDDIRRWHDYQFSNCSLTHLRFDPKPALLTLNQTFHL
ncbi:MAG: histidine phosphatase family protein [Pseudomonadota bacterium]